MNTPQSMLSPWQARQCRNTLRQGGIIAYPTEAVWGVGCDPWNSDAVDRLLDLKQRPAAKGLILAASSVEQIEFLLAPLTYAQREAALAWWPGPVTCLLPDVRDQIPANVKGTHTSIAVRVSDHPVVKAVCEAAGHPVVSTSCNPASRPPARWSWQVRRYFGAGIDCLIGGDLGGARRPSRIFDIVSGQWLR